MAKKNEINEETMDIEITNEVENQETTEEEKKTLIKSVRNAITKEKAIHALKKVGKAAVLVGAGALAVYGISRTGKSGCDDVVDIPEDDVTISEI